MAKNTHTARTPKQEWVRAGVLSLVLIVVAGIFIYWRIYQGRIYIETASIEAPEIDLAPSEAGTFEESYVQEGDTVLANTIVARVGNELLKSKVAGIVISITKNIGADVKANETVVTMVDPSALRVVGRIDEDKGLKNVSVGDTVVFTVDAFGGKKYSAVVDEVASASRNSGVVFNISDKREVKQFEIKGRFDTNNYSELKNGMSARMYIYKQ